MRSFQACVEATKSLHTPTHSISEPVSYEALELQAAQVGILEALATHSFSYL